MRLLPLTLAASAALAACVGPAQSPAAPAAPSASAPPAVSAPAEAMPDLPNAVPTEPLAEHEIRVKVGDLPAPFATESARKGPEVVPPPADPVLRVPPGFAVQVWADGLEHPRWLALAPDGAVLLVESRHNRIKRLEDRDGDGVAEAVETIGTEANGLDLPLGVAFLGGDLYVGNTSDVRRYGYAAGRPLAGTGTVVADLPGRGYNQHWTRNVVASPDGDSLYVTVGSESNVSPEALPRASVFRIAPDGSGRQTVSFGLRNPVGLDFHPATGAPYTTVNERDGLGDGLVPDYLTRIGGDRFFGWPYAYLTADNLDPRRTTAGGASERPDLAARTVTPDVLFEAHSAALGLQFYPLDGGSTASNRFPERYRGGAFVAMRGSWNRSRGTGYKVVHVPFVDGRPTGAYRDFLTGFLIDPSGPTTWGRPVGLLVLPDGSMLVTEEGNGRIYRVSYRGEAM